MKKFFVSVLLALALCPSQTKAQQNPILPGFHADPEIVYSNLTHRYYIYSTTDGAPGWGGYTYRCFSSADLKEWRDEGEVLNAKNGQIPWANGNLWAPAIEEVKVGKGKYKYYLYYSANPKAGGGKEIGVAVSDSPTGRVFKIALKSCAFFTYSIDALDHQIWRKVFIRPFLNVTVSSFL